jgi:DNA repair protein RecN (Recombination protein N)
MQNLALIEDVSIDLEPGFCAWTGETGAGKSLLLTGLGLVLGEKASADLIRAGKSEARAAAIFDLDQPRLQQQIEQILGGQMDDNQLIITRRVSAQGRGTATVNGLPVTIATLGRLGETLIDIHGQHEGRALLDPERHRDLLDEHGGLHEVLTAYRSARSEYESLRRRRQQLLETTESRARERALLEFEHEELAAADPQPHEYADLTRQAQRLQSVEQLRSAASLGYALLYENDRSAQDLLKRVARDLEPLARSRPELAEAASTLERIAEEAREIAFTLRDLGAASEDDPSKLEAVETRMALYRRLANRFRCTPDQLAARYDEVQQKLAVLDDDDAGLLALDAPLALAWKNLKLAASQLTAARKKIAKNFARAIQARLKPLGLAGARLTVSVEPRDLADDPTSPAPPESGADRVEFLFSANPGEELRPLRKIASGGELSRVTLAVKTVLAGADHVPTLVFDEIDTGVGGRLGSALGKTLAELAQHHQVICITHLPQVASYATRQWAIRKQVDRGRSRTTITPLAHAERIDELAAMLRGDSAAKGTRQEAIAMLKEAKATR